MNVAITNVEERRNVKFDLEERTGKFGSSVIEFARLIPKNAVTLPLVSQLVRSGTSVGANYCEADDAESRNDFKHKIGICKKEARETRHWLKMILVAESSLSSKAAPLIQEAKELNLIFNAIVNSTNKAKII